MITPSPVINIDEVGRDLDETLSFLKENGLNEIELRTIDSRNLATFDDEQVAALDTRVRSEGLSVTTIASPLFKWYQDNPAQLKPFDNFGFPGVLSFEEKRAVCNRLVRHAAQLGCRKVRIFSGLRAGDETDLFPEAELLAATLADAEREGVTLLLENEPVCNCHRLDHLIRILNRFPKLGCWLDIANLVEIGEPVDEDHLRPLLPRVNHVHLKDFRETPQGRHFCVLGSGDVPWRRLLPFLLSERHGQLSFSLETHVPTAEKRSVTAASVAAFREITRSIVN